MIRRTPMVLLLLALLAIFSQLGVAAEPAAPAPPAPPAESEVQPGSEAPSTSDETQQSDEPTSDETKQSDEPTSDEIQQSDEPTSEDDEYELHKLLVDTLDQVERNYVEGVTRRQLVEAAIRGVLRELDPYSSYINPAQMRDFRDSVDNEFGGIGVRISKVGTVLTVTTPLPGTPAYRQGVRAGDRVLKIDGDEIDELSIDQIVGRLKGDPGDPVTLTIVHLGKSEEEEITIVREIVQVETVLGDRRGPDQAWDFLLDHEQAIGYIRITGFSRNTARDLRRALQSLEEDHFHALILDLRYNPGGLLSSAIAVSDMFISEGRIVSTTGRNTEERVWDAHAPGVFAGFPLVILVNRLSASASEIVSACLQDHDRAVVMGERTWGKGSVQNVIELESGASALKLTTAGYQRPSGKKIHRFPKEDEDDEWGVLPNDGYLLRLTDREMVAQMADRSRRDIVMSGPNESEGQDDAGDEGDAEHETEVEQFVDPHLRMALDYLSDELAKAE